MPPEDEGTYRQSSESVAKPPRKKPAKFHPDGRSRRVKIHMLTTSEMIGLSLLNPMSAGLLGWGINMLLAWAQMPDGASNKTMFGVGAFALVAIGGVLQLAMWALVAYVYATGHDANE